MSLMRRKKTPQGRGARPRAPTEPAAAQARIEAAFRKHTAGNRWVMLAIAPIWLMAAAYYFLMPPTYHSKWSLIMPTANSGSTVSLESIGQTSTNPSQPFGSVTLSPKVIYKEIARSDEVRRKAAATLGIPTHQIGKPRVKLIAETALMNFRMSGSSPEDAQAKANALMSAFQAQLNALRTDEQERRAEIVRNSLKVYRANLDKTRAQMLAFQKSSGLLSLDQFREASVSAELIRRKLSNARADREKLISQQSKLISQLGVSSDIAAAGVRLASDPSFEKLANAYAVESAKLHQAKLRFGPRHPRLGVLRMRAEGVMDEIELIATRFGIATTASLPQVMLVINSSNQADLLKTMVANESALAGRTQEIAALEAELARIETNVAKMGKSASQLEALKKEHLVAEAVYTSAAARLDIGRNDVFDSYPMVQVFSQPSIPENRSQPRLSYAIAAGILGSFFVLMAWGALWVHRRFGLRR